MDTNSFSQVPTLIETGNIFHPGSFFIFFYNHGVINDNFLFSLLISRESDILLYEQSTLENDKYYNIIIT